MWITDDRVSQKNIKLPCGGGVTLPGAAGGLLPAMFPVASALPIDEPQLDSWQVIVVRVDETPARDFSEQAPPCDSQNRRRPMDMKNSLNILVHTVVQGGPVGPQKKEPLALLVLDHADPVGWHAVIRMKLLGPAGPKVEEPLVAGNCLPVMFPTAPVPSANGPQQGMLPDRSVPVLNRIGNGRLTCLRLLETFVQRCWPGVPPPRAGLVNSVGPVGPSPHA